MAALTSSSANVALLEITATGLKKSIMDATAPVRRLLSTKGFHDYGKQAQGQHNKVVIPAVIHGPAKVKESKASLYRPETKNGDPRIWFYGLKQQAAPSDILAIIPHQGTLHLINLTDVDAEGLSRQQGHSINRLLASILEESSIVSNELLERLRGIAARGLIRSVIDAPADTAIGRTLEHELGIDMNSSKAPDYKGIELKAYRKRRKSQQVRKNLFAQVPDWNISKLKSSAEILEAFGYHRDGDFKLYCQVEATRRNSQGLMLRLDDDAGRLWENSDNPQYGDFAVWPMERLHERLLEKHAETFWVGARQELKNKREYFQFTDVIHTKKPITSQFDILVQQGDISLDHLIKRRPNGSAHEKGPLFKVEPDSLSILFPPPDYYTL